MRFSRTLLTIGLAALTLTLWTGCGSQEDNAQALLSQGKYQQVIDKYPDTQYARRAEALIAEELLKAKQYEEVIQKYPQTPAAFKAQQAGAQALFDAHRYQEVIDKYPNAELAARAKNVLADSLYAAGDLDGLLVRFPENEKAVQVKNERADAALAQAKKLTGKAKEDALNKIVNDFKGTPAYKEAYGLLRDVRTPTPGKK